MLLQNVGSNLPTELWLPRHIVRPQAEQAGVQQLRQRCAALRATNPQCSQFRVARDRCSVRARQAEGRASPFRASRRPAPRCLPLLSGVAGPVLATSPTSSLHPSQLPMTEDQLAIYRRFTGRSTPPTKALHEAWLVIGRRGGKSFVLAVIAVFLACFRDWRPFLGPGEVGTVIIIAADRRQARVIMRYCTGLLTAVPMLAKLIEAESRETIELKNRIVIEIHTASFRTTRGYTIVAALCDELAYWHSDETSAEPDVEVINALRPACRPSRMPCCCAHRAHMRAGARCGMPIVGIMARTATRCWCGRPTHDR
jgi:hypothetical protein